MPADQHFDVAIVGGGLVGAALAAALAPTKLSICVMDSESMTTDAALTTTPKTVHDVEPRVSAITYATQTLLANVGAWQNLPLERCGAYTRMEVWDADGTGAVNFNAAETGEAALGWIIENRVLAAALQQACRVQNNIAWRAAQRVQAMTRVNGHWQLEMTDGQRVRARLLVGADGAQSQVRERLGFRTSHHDYQQHAIVATVQTEWPHDACARQRFLDRGPLAFLPLASERERLCSVVWSVAPSDAGRLLKLDDAAFAKEIGHALEDRLGGIMAISPRHAFPLIERHAEQYVQGNAVLVGDAAHTVHPLAGQGVNLGFLDAATLAEEIARNLARGLPFDEPLALRRYERRRRLHNAVMQKTFAGFKTLFETRALPVRWLRNTGMALFDGIPPLKALAARQAMGLDGDLPDLCRPPRRGAHL